MTNITQMRFHCNASVELICDEILPECEFYKPQKYNYCVYDINRCGICSHSGAQKQFVQSWLKTEFGLKLLKITKAPHEGDVSIMQWWEEEKNANGK